MSQLSDFRKGEENIFEFEYSGSFISVIVPPGFYFFEVFGAEGGQRIPQTNSNVSTGLGGYSSGALNLNKETLLFVYVGGKGGDCSGCSTVSGGFNGGGSVSQGNSGGGGGGTDIRVEIDDFHHRIIVAGGGGGLEWNGHEGYSGSGGGYSGQNGHQANYGSVQGGGGGTTLQGTHFGGGGLNPSFGVGGSSIIAHSGGGGGGWYGGGAGGNNGNGGGGSGYIYSSETSHQYPLPKPSEEFYLTNFTSENGVRTGHGFSRITFIGTSFNSKNYIHQSMICIHANYINI